MALSLDMNGASKVFVVGRREDALKETAALASNGSIVPIQGDISSKDSLEGVYQAVSAQTTHVDLLIANAGTMGPEAQPRPKSDGSQPSIPEIRDRLWAVSQADFTNVFDVNITGTYYTVVAFLPLLDAANKKRTASGPQAVLPPQAQVVITSSIAGYARILPYSVAYSVSKAAIMHLVKMLSTVFAPYGIRANGITPGLYHSDMGAVILERYGIQGTGTSDGSVPRELIPAARAGRDEDLGGLILWLASTAGAYINGAIIISDGGLLGGFPASY